MTHEEQQGLRDIAHTILEKTLCKHDDGDCHADDPCDDCPKYPSAEEQEQT